MRLGAEERREQVGLRLGGHARAGVLDRQRRPCRPSTSARMVIVPVAADRFDGVLQDVQQRLLDLRRDRSLTRIAGASSSQRQAMPAASGRALSSAHDAARGSPTSSHGCRAGGGSRKTSAKPRMKLFSCSVRSMTMPSACSKSWRLVGAELAGVGQRRVQQRVRGGDGVVHLVRHHADQLLVGGALELAQLLGQLLDEQEAAREAAIDEACRAGTSTRRAPSSADHARSPGASAASASASGDAERVEPAADHRRPPADRAGARRPG